MRVFILAGGLLLLRFPPRSLSASVPDALRLLQLAYFLFRLVFLPVVCLLPSPLSLRCVLSCSVLSFFLLPAFIVASCMCGFFSSLSFLGVFRCVGSPASGLSLRGVRLYVLFLFGASEFMFSVGVVLFLPVRISGDILYPVVLSGIFRCFFRLLVSLVCFLRLLFLLHMPY